MAHSCISNIEFLRTQSEPPSSAVAAYSSSISFKSFSQVRKPQSKMISHHFSTEGIGFTGSDFKKTATADSIRTTIPLGTGRPCANFYPWSQFTLHANSFEQDNFSCDLNGAKEPKIVKKYGGPFDLATGLNYGHASGSPQLIRFVTEHVELVHNPPYADWGSCLTAGSTSALEITLRMFCDRGDTVLVEQFTYPGFLALTDLLGVNTCGIEMDTEGLRHDQLKQKLEDWDTSTGLRPRILYMIPSGQNPTSSTQSERRRRKIYEIAEEYDLIIIEDDPYYFLRLGESSGIIDERTGFQAEVYLEMLLPSYITLDRSGRVVRLDSVSKVLAPGLRAGWITANTEVINKFIAYSEVSTSGVSGPAQIMLFELLDRQWGHRGYFQWLNTLSLHYNARLNVVLSSCSEFLPEDICNWVTPAYGMFLWITLDLKLHPMYHSRMKAGNDMQALSVTAIQVENFIASNAIKNGVTVTKGSVFSRTNDVIKHQIYFRLTFAAVVKSLDLREGIKRFSDVLKAEFRLD